MFVGDFNSKLEAFGCASKNTSGPILKTIQNKLNLIYVNNDEHTHMDRRRTGNTDIPDMAFISQNLAIHDIQFQIGVDLGSDHLPIEISIDTNNKKRSRTQLDSRKQVIAFQDRVITINIKEAQHPLKREKQVIDKSSIMLKISTKSMHRVLV